MKNILWVTEGFPTSLEPFNGDGIERRAKAVSLYHKVFIIFVKKNPRIKFGKIEIEERFYNENCQALIYYYPSIKKFSHFLDILLSNYYFLTLHFKAYRLFKKKYGTPAGIQVNVTMKAGIIALYFKWFRHIRYIVVEGWSLFLPEEKKQLQKKTRLFRFLARLVLKNASKIITVSKHLGEMINEEVLPISYQVIPSVVDHTIFFRNSTAKNNTIRFIHISDLAPTKNIGQILLGLQKVLMAGYAVELIIHAPFNEALKDKIEMLGLQKQVILKSEVRQEQLADSVRSCDALILFSLFETFGNVIIEAQACGLPVITSDYPTFFEIIENDVNGIIARGKDAAALAEAMIHFLENRIKFQSENISARAIHRYSFSRVGMMFDKVYKETFPG